MIAAQKIVKLSTARRLGKSFLFSPKLTINLLHQYQLMMKLTVFTVSTLLAIVVATPAKVDGTDLLIF
jgi:hypothetical protein